MALIRNHAVDFGDLAWLQYQLERPDFEMSNDGTGGQTLRRSHPEK
jgi:hypothetical protein